MDLAGPRKSPCDLRGKADILKLVIGAIGLQAMAIIGAAAVLMRLAPH